jgi:hypothetical protein
VDWAIENNIGKLVAVLELQDAQHGCEDEEDKD